MPPSPYGPSPWGPDVPDILGAARKTLRTIGSAFTNRPVERRLSRFLTSHVPAIEGPLPEDVEPGTFEEALYRTAPSFSQAPQIGRRGRVGLAVASALAKGAEIPLVPGAIKETKEALSTRGKAVQRISEVLPLTPVDLGLRAAGLSGYLPAIAGSAERLGETAAFRKRVVQEIEKLTSQMAKAEDFEQAEPIARRLKAYQKALASLPESEPLHGLPLREPPIPKFDVTPEGTAVPSSRYVNVPGNKLPEIKRVVEAGEIPSGRSFESPTEISGYLESPGTVRDREIVRSIANEPRLNRQNELARLEKQMDDVVEQARHLSRAERGPHTKEYLALRRRYEELLVPPREPMVAGPGGIEAPVEKPFGLLPAPGKAAATSSFRGKAQVPQGKGRISAGWIRGLYGRGMFGRIREAGGAPDVPNETAQSIASRFENYEANAAENLAKARSLAEDAEKRFAKLPGESWRPVARAIGASKPGQYVMTGNADIDENIIKPLLDKRFALYEEATSAGVPIPGITGTPHIDPRIPELILLAEENEPKALAALRKKWVENRPEMGVPSEQGLMDQVRQLKQIGEEYRPSGQRTQVPLPNLIQKRTLNLPGHLGDPDSPLGTKHGFIEAQGLYDEQWARGVAYHRNFGPNAVELFGELEAAPSRPFKELVHSTLSKTVGEYPTSDAMRKAGQALADWRAMHAAAHLQGFGLTNLPQTFKTTFPYSARNVGLATATKNYLLGIKDSLARGGSDFANSVGALSSQTALTLAALEGRDIGARGIPRLAAELTMVLSGGKKTEVLNNVISVNTGLRDIDTLYNRIRSGGKSGMRAEETIRRVLRAMPEEAEDLIQQGRSGQPLFNETAESASDAILGPPRVRDAARRFVYEYAPETQFRVTPGRMPELASTPLGRWHFQYKNFQHQYLFFLNDNVFGPAVEWAQTGGKSGSIAPMQAWLIGGAIPGGKAFRVGRMLLNGYTPEEIDKKLEGEGDIESAIKNESVFGGLGLAQNLVEGAMDITSKDPFRMVRGIGTLGAPTIGSAIETAGDIAENPLKGTARALVSEVAPAPPGVKGIAMRVFRNPPSDNPLADLPDPFKEESRGVLRQIWKSRALSDAFSDIDLFQPSAPTDTTDWRAYWEEQGRLRRARMGVQ